MITFCGVLVKILGGLGAQSLGPIPLSTMLGSKTRLERFVYLVCLKEGSELLSNRFFKNKSLALRQLCFYSQSGWKSRLIECNGCETAS